jgi:hypothetical protein
MAKASPAVRSFNAGEFSDLMGGRPDLDRYPSSALAMLNYAAAPQGPAIGRSGTSLVNDAARHAEYSRLVPFVYSEDEVRVLEFGSDRIRFYSEDGGLQTYAPVDMTVTSLPGFPIVFTSATLGALVGEDVVLSGLPAATGLNGVPLRVVTRVGTTFTLESVWPAAQAIASGDAARVYHVACAYSEAQRQSLRALQSVNVIYLFTSAQPRKLSRFGDYDWRLTSLELEDGPYLPTNTTATTLTASATGNPVTVMVSNAGGPDTAAASSERPAITGTLGAPVQFLQRNIGYTLATGTAFRAFDGDEETYWASNEQQKGNLEVTLAVPFAVDGYVIHLARDNQDTTYTSKDYAPSKFALDGWNGSAWIEIDKQEEYVLYDGNKSTFIPVPNTVVYSKYRLRVMACLRNGLIEPRVARLVLRKAGATFNLTASAVTGINDGAGFLTTDVGRLVRIKGSDGAWRSCRITARVSATVVTVALLGEPLTDTKAIREWRLGYWSDTTGWPNAADFHEDRLWLGGSTAFPDLVAASVTGGYENFSQTDSEGVVLDDSAMAFRLNSRKLSRVQWLSADDKGLVVGTGSEEYSVKGKGGDALTARNVEAKRSTQRGSKSVEPVRIDSQLLYVQRGGRAVREFAFVYEADNYKSPSMSQLASHIGAIPFAEMAYAQEPYSIVWMRRVDGTVVGLTYNRDEGVVGWHRHDFSGGYVESIAVVPQSDGLQDALWLVVRRTVNNVTRRYIERLTRFWDFNTDVADAHFVDCALRYDGAETMTVDGLHHLEGEDVYGLADLKPVGPLRVLGGQVVLPFAASSAILGLGFDAFVVLPRLEAGAADGTAQGKIKRIHGIATHVWRSYGGEVGVWNHELNDFVLEPLIYETRTDDIEEAPTLFTGVLKPITAAPGYDLDGMVKFMRPRHTPLPLNVAAVMPQLHTQDR